MDYKDRYLTFNNVSSIGFTCGEGVNEECIADAYCYKRYDCKKGTCACKSTHYRSSSTLCKGK